MLSKTTDIKLLSTVSKCIANRQFKDALKLLEHVQLKDNFWLVARARCFLGLETPLAALRVIEQVKGRTTDEHRFIIAEAYEALGSYYTAITHLKKISSPENKERIHLRIAQLFEKEAERIMRFTAEKEALLRDASNYYKRHLYNAPHINSAMWSYISHRVKHINEQLSQFPFRRLHAEAEKALTSQSIFPMYVKKDNDDESEPYELVAGTQDFTHR